MYTNGARILRCQSYRWNDHLWKSSYKNEITLSTPKRGDIKFNRDWKVNNFLDTKQNSKKQFVKMNLAML